MSNFLHYLTLGYLYQGALIALEITAGAFVAGFLLALLLVSMREARASPVRWVATIYIWLFRGTPILLQLIFLYDVLPYAGIRLSPMLTAITGFALNEGAFQCEILRGGLHSVPQDQVLAAEALGMNRYVILRRILLPQAMKAVIPPFGNEAVNLLKNTSLASVIAVSELTQRAESIAAANFQYIAVLCASGVMYLALTTAIAIAQSLLERRHSPTRGPRRPAGGKAAQGVTTGVPPTRAALAVSSAGTPESPAVPSDT